MKKLRAILFIDYHDTFNDVNAGKGHVFADAYKKFARNFDSVSVVVITSTKHNEEGEYFRDNLASTIEQLPFKNDFKYLIENTDSVFSEVKVYNGLVYFDKCGEFTNFGNKKYGVERMIDILDRYYDEKFDVVVTIGDSITSDLPMINADVKGATNYFILTRRKTDMEELNKLAPTFKVVGDYKQEINTSSKKIIIKSAPQSYGIALGLDAIVEHLRSNEYSR